MANNNVDIMNTTIMYDTYHDVLLDFAKNRNKTNQLQIFIKDIFNKNRNALSGYHIGLRIYINAKDWDRFWNIIGLKPADIKKTIQSIPRYADVNYMIDQFMCASILILLTGAYTSIKNENMAMFVYLFTYLKPYASSVTQIFPIEPNAETIETMMNYDPDFDNKFTLKKVGSLIGCLKSLSEGSYNGNFKDRKRKDVMAGRITDNDLWVTFQSNIWTAIRQFLKPIYREHDKVKNNPTRYTTDIEVTDSDDEKTLLDTSNGETDAKRRLLFKINKVFSMSPVNEEYAKIAINKSGIYVNNAGLHDDTSNVPLRNLKTFIQVSLDNDHEKCSALFNYLVTAFLNTINPSTNKKYTINDIHTANFPAKVYSIIYDTRNTVDPNKIEAKNIVKDLFSHNMEQFNGWPKDGTYQKQYTKAFVVYCSIFIQKNS